MQAPQVFPFVLQRTAFFGDDVLLFLETDWYTCERELEHATASLLEARNTLLDILDQALLDIPPSELRSRVYKTRQLFHDKNKIKQEDRDSLPEPLIKAILAWEKAHVQFEGSSKKLEITYQNELERSFTCIQSHAQNPKLQRALLFSSHSLLKRLPDLAQKPIQAWRKKDRQTALALAQYLIRAASKTSPLSWFTTLSVYDKSGRNIQDNTRVRLSLNVALLPYLYHILDQDEAFFNRYQFRLNPSFHNKQGWVYFDGENEAFQDIDESPFFNALSDYLCSLPGNIPYSELSQWLSEQTAGTQDQIHAFIRSLVDQGLIEPILPVNGLSANWHADLYIHLQNGPLASSVQTCLKFLEAVSNGIEKLRACLAQDGLKILESIQQEVQSLARATGMEAPNIPNHQLVYEDVFSKITDSKLPDPDQIAGQLAAQLKLEKRATNSRAAHFLSYVRTRLQAHSRVSWLEAARGFLEAGAPGSVIDEFSHQPPLFHGALVQTFNDEGEEKWVLNALYPGGGKLMPGGQANCLSKCRKLCQTGIPIQYFL
ncbi:MAG: lantibiotic dehydratase [Saprospiraceae bacterium]